MSRRQRVVFKSAFVLLGGLALIAILALAATQTGYGQDQLRKLVASFLSGKIQGKVYVGRIHGGLLSGVTLDSLEIRDLQDTLFVSTGPVRVKYDIRDMFDKRVLLRYVEIDHPVVYIREHPDGHWNWRKIFPSGPPGEKSAARKFGDFIVIDSAKINDLKFTLTLRWQPAAWFKGARRDSVIRAALSHPTEEIRRSGNGFTRTWRFTGGNVSTGYVRLADPDSAGLFIRIRNADLTVKDPPFRFTRVAADVRQMGDSIWLNASRISLPGSHGKAVGKLVWGSDLPLRYAIHVNADRIAMQDIAWIYPTLPRTGGGSLDLDIVSEKNPHIIDYRITNMDVQTTRSRLLGSMTYAVGGEILGVKDVDLVADPVDFDLLRTLNGKPFPYDWQGKLTGTVVASGGPLTNFHVDESDITFSDAHVPGALSKFRGRGELDILFPAFTVFHGFDVNMTKLDLRTLQYLNPLFPRLRGNLSGTARLDSSWMDVRFSNADVLHHDEDAPVSRVTGKGRVIWGEKFLTYDVDLQGQPIWLTTLARSYPVLPLRGEVSGPIRIRGTSENLQIAASMTGPAGAFSFDGYVDADPPAYGARGNGTVAGLDLKTLVVGKAIPDTRLNGQYALDIAGADAEATAEILLALIGWYAQDIQLVALFVGALLALAAVLALLAQAALLLGSGVQHMAHGPLRFGLAQLLRHRFDSTLQLGAFTLALFLIALLALVRSDLIDRWRQQLPPQAPNHFLVNISPAQTEAVRQFLAARQLQASELYPMVRGRLTTKNGAPIESTLTPEQRENNSLRRELNLTWTDTLAANNQILAGRWHGKQALPEISVESGMAEKLNLALGDTLGFTIGDQTIAARISSIRSVKWDSMQPNFFVIFAPGQLDSLPANYIASVYIPPTQTQLLPEFVKTFPSVTVIALDKLIANLEAVFNQIIGAIQLLLGFLLAAGLAVVLATLLASLDARQHEAVLLRTLGAQRAYLAKGLGSEFVVLGLLAGLLASVCAEIAMAVIADRMFDLPLQLHPWLWLILPLSGALIVGASGWLTTRHITRVPPIQSIRAMT